MQTNATYSALSLPVFGTPTWCPPLSLKLLIMSRCCITKSMTNHMAISDFLIQRAEEVSELDVTKPASQHWQHHGEYPLCTN
ncbi:hypothetical protein Plhal304r1_c067g0155331 [Plasmopara halstedii]